MCKLASANLYAAGLLVTLGTSLCHAVPQCTNLPPRPNFPTVADQDHPSEPDEPMDTCLTIGPIRVPAIPFDKPVNEGWGSLVVVFNMPIDGGAFLFPPDCPTPLQGTLNANGQQANGTNDPKKKNTAIEFVPIIRDGKNKGKNKAYAFEPTPKNANFNNSPNGFITVSIMYDNTGGMVPRVVDAYWKSKLTTDFTFRPTRKDYPKNPFPKKTFFDIKASVPEPAFWPPLVISCAYLACLFTRRQRKFGKL